MKRLALALMTLIVLTAFTACVKKTDNLSPDQTADPMAATATPEQPTAAPTAAPTETPTPTLSPVTINHDGPYTIAEYYPRNENQMVYYEGNAIRYGIDDNGGELVAEDDLYAIYFQDHIQGNRNQSRVMSFIGGREASAAEVFEMTEYELRLVFTQGNYFDHSYLLDEEINMDMLILEAPLEVGHKWIRYQSGANIETAEIISLDTLVTVPFGTFEAMVVEVVDDARGVVSHEYYVPGLGRVRSEHESSYTYQYLDMARVEDTELMDVAEMYYDWYVAVEYDDEGGEIYHMEPLFDPVTFTYPTNGDVVAVYSDLILSYLRERYDYAPGADVRINSLTLDRFRNTLRIDMSPAFIDEMNQAGENENLYLQLFADTLGWLYNAFSVTFSIDGGPYVSDNVTIDPEAGDVIELTRYKDASQYVE